MSLNIPDNYFNQYFFDSLQNSKLIFDNSENVIYFLDCATRKYDYMNSAVSELTGYTMQELNEIGFKSIIKEVIESSKNLGVKENTDKPNIIVEDFSAKYLIETKSGKLKWVEDIAFAKLDQNGRKDSCIGVLRNVTPLHNLFEQMQTEKNQLDTILDIAEVLFMMFDSNYELIFINKKASSMLGFSKEDALGKNWIDNFTPAQSRAELKNKFEKLFKGSPEIHEIYEHAILTKTGEEKIISWHNSVIYDENKQVKFLVSSGNDVTEKKRDDKIQQVISEILQAANSEKNVEELFKFIHNAISKLMPAENFYISLYEKENNLIKFPYFIDQYDEAAPPQRYGKGLTEYILRTGKSALVNQEKDNELVALGETEMMGTPTTIWLGIPLKIKENTIGVMVVQDYHNETTYGEREREILEVISYPISRAIERKIVEQERNDLITKLKELNESKDKLFSLISHDLRSPFNSLLGFSEILTSEYETLTHDEVKEYLNVIYESSKNLFSMTNNLLQFSRFQMGKFDFNPINLNLKKLIQNNINLLKGNALKKQLNLNTEIDIDAEVFADEDMLNSIVQNLLSNAIKFTAKGGEIRIEARLLNNTEPKQVELRIDDSGVGIAPEELVKIFKDHMHSTPGTEKEYGTGLGLLLVKEFVELNGGKIHVKSKLGKGTTFNFILPVSNLTTS